MSLSVYILTPYIQVKHASDKSCFFYADPNYTQNFDYRITTKKGDHLVAFLFLSLC